MGEFGRLYEQQYAVALFNKVRFEIEGNGGPQSQLLHRKVPLEDKSIFSGNLFQFLEENKKWRNRFLYVPDSYSVMFYETKLAYDRGLHPKGTINCAGYKVLTSVEEYGELMTSSLPGLKAKAGTSMFSKCATQFPIILWHPYARHHYFCVTSEKEHQKWLAVFQDCVRHTNNGYTHTCARTHTPEQCTLLTSLGKQEAHSCLPEESKVQIPAFTDAVRLYRQCKGQYGTWDMMCGDPPQVRGQADGQGPWHGARRARTLTHSRAQTAGTFSASVLTSEHCAYPRCGAGREAVLSVWAQLRCPSLPILADLLPSSHGSRLASAKGAAALLSGGGWCQIASRGRVFEKILANLVMESLHLELRGLISPRLKGKVQERQRNWMLVSRAVGPLVPCQTRVQYEAVVQRCEAGRPPLEASIRTDMDQIITSKEHVTGKIRALVLPKAEQFLKQNVEPYISSILEALMEPTSRGFAEVRDVFFRELVDMSKNVVNEGGREKLGEVSMLAYHPVKMNGCYSKVEELHLEGLQQRFGVSSPSVFVQRAQILMREQMDNAVYTFEQLLHQSLESQGSEELCKIIQRCQDRVIKKYDYDSSTVRKKFFREALLQIIIPYMLKQLSPTCKEELPQFQELIFEDFSRFILVENIFEEVVLQSVMKDIMQAVKEAAVQRRHNLYRDSIVLTNSDPNLHLLGEGSPINWGGDVGDGEGSDGGGGGGEPTKRRRIKQVVSMIQVDGTLVVPNESCLEVPGVGGIPEDQEGEAENSGTGGDAESLKSPDSIHEIRDLITPKVEVQVSLPTADAPLTNGTVPQEASVTDVTSQEADKAAVPAERGVQEAAKSEPRTEEGTQEMVKSEPRIERAEATEQAAETRLPSNKQEEPLKEEPAAEHTKNSPVKLAPPLPVDSDSSHHHHDDSGFQSPANEDVEEDQVQPITKGQEEVGDTIADPAKVEVTLEEKEVDPSNDLETGEEVSGKESPSESIVPAGN
ncbi:NIBL1 protein, partial [Atractosteus spatula]|nr:NIBL1 protein [Atractosteus spatula]